MADSNRISEYAQLLVRVGINLQPGQRLVISTPVECAAFARRCVCAAYDAGAADVVMIWRDDYCTRQRFLRADDSSFDSAYEWDVLRNISLARKGAGYISIDAGDPQNLRGVDAGRLQNWERANGRDNREFYDKMTNNEFPWCVASLPVLSWARQVFPDADDEQAMEQLWQQIFSAVRVDGSGNSVAAWQEHCERLGSTAARLTQLQLTRLHYRYSLGTDLSVGLPQGHIWLGGADTLADGRKIVANMPTEEVFTAPHREQIDGVLCSSRPLVLNGNIVDGIRLGFRNGRIEEISAAQGEDILRAAIDTDAGSRYIGEIALVPANTPVSRSGLLFYNVLFDENASCHFAFGEAYPVCLRGGEKMSGEELLAHGVNAVSDTHVDFMVGSEDLTVTGETAGGEQVTVYKDGDFAV